MNFTAATLEVDRLGKHILGMTYSELLQERFLIWSFACIVAALLVTYLIYEAFATNFAKIQGIPEVEKALPFTGHLHALGGRRVKSDASTFSDWAKATRSDIFQCRLGNQRTIVVSSWSAVKDLWVNHSNNLSDRPDQPGFVEKLGVDITGTSMTDQIRRCRAAAMRALGKNNWPQYYHLVEPTSVAMVKDVLDTGQNGKKAINVYYHLRHLAFDLALSLTYGARYGELDNAFMERFLWSINAISAVRSSTKKFRHFIPILRWIPEFNSETIQAERVRAKHIKILYSSFRDRVAAGETVDCIVSSLAKDKLSEDEIHGTCISLLQAAPDTVASGIYQALAWLSKPEGQETQDKIYQSILETYNRDKTAAWNNAFREEKVPLLVSMYKETLRYFTLTPGAVPRKTSRAFEWLGVHFPKGITMIMNAQQVNHDTEHFGLDAWSFDPERYLHDISPLPHMTYGAGSRICPAVGISNRLMYAVLLRLILAFKIEEPKEEMDGRKPSVHPINFSDVRAELVAQPRFFDAHFTARDDLWLKSVLI